MSAAYRLDVLPAQSGPDQHLAHEAAVLGLGRLTDLRRSRYYLLRGELDQGGLERLGARLLSDPVVERFSLTPPDAQGRRVIEVQRKAGVMDPVEASILKGASDLGLRVDLVRCGTRVEVAGASDDELTLLAWKCLANQAIEEVAIDPLEAVRLRAPGGASHQVRTEVRRPRPSTAASWARC